MAPPAASDSDVRFGPVELRAIAREVCLGAAEVVNRGRALGFGITTKSSLTDVVTDVDLQVERFIRSRLTVLRPQDAVLGEEHGGPPAGQPGRVRWLVDPIDGTVNFMLGLPFYSISIAAEVDGVVLAGCVHNPVSGALFEASLGGGAYLDGARLRGPRSVALPEAVVATGFSYDPGRRARQGELVGRLLAQVGNLRRTGSAALDLCALAAGWFDFYFEGPLNEWDFAAGALIAAEAGATLGGLLGRGHGPWMVAAGHPDHCEEFFALLERLGAVAD
jgi:myo-inositol-1(or 4)-monophosphatase